MFRSRWPNRRALLQRALKCCAPAAMQSHASVPAVHSAPIPLHALILHTISTAKESPLYHLPASPKNNMWKWVKPILTGLALWASCFDTLTRQRPSRRTFSPGWSFLGSTWHAMAGFCVSIQDSYGATLSLVPFSSLVVVPLTGGGGGGRMWGDATLVCSRTVEGGIHSAYFNGGRRTWNGNLNNSF